MKREEYWEGVGKERGGEKKENNNNMKIVSECIGWLRYGKGGKMATWGDNGMERGSREWKGAY